MISFTCTGCGKPFEVEDGLAGRRCRCKRCGNLMSVPEPEPLLPPLPAIAPAAVSRAEPEPPTAPRRRKRKRKPRALEGDAWVSLGAGAALAVLALLVPLVGLLPDMLSVVIHELGHVATAWLLGSPALPSFDLSYGGGVSYVFDRQPLLILIVYAALGLRAFRERGDRRALWVVLIAAGLYSIAVFTPLRGLLITAMGHGAELLVAGIFLYRALSGSAILERLERPLYAFLGLYIVLADVRFAYRLMSSREDRAAYGEAKGGGHWMDFSQIADQSLHARLELVAALFLLACLLTPVAAFLVHRRGRHRT
jgi:hypothetical protein